LRKITKKLPDFLLALIANIFNIVMSVYIWLCEFINLPMKKYVLKVFDKLDWHSRKMVIFDQLNPSYAKYYCKNEAENLLKFSCFKNIRIINRHNYSWTISGEK
jgi:hypothetical protein